ncbi:CPBP family intramembrane metalloprotease [Flavihumibacter sediminis]|nr:CPBP family intramembrane metalloprotease [Flavihumibacter sediminis]
MAGIIVELIISWLLLWFICRKHLSVLGFRPTKRRVTNLGIGFLIAASCCTVYQLMTTAFINNSWILNKQVTAGEILKSSRWNIISVLYEELIFRGALLYIAIKKIGVKRACILSAVCFGIYHWFTFNVMGNPFMMVITFLMTAIVGFSWAYAFAKTSSLYLPIGLHLGWNLFCMVVFSNGSSGQAIFVRANENQLEGVLSLLVFIFQVFALPLFTFWYLDRLSRKQKLPEEKEQESTPHHGKAV